jgi:dynein heavy chain
MFVGNTGTGKTANIMSKLSRMDPEATTYTTINMNSFSDAPSLQIMMEQPLEKKSGVRYGPPGARRYALSNGAVVCFLCRASRQH